MCTPYQWFSKKLLQEQLYQISRFARNSFFSFSEWVLQSSGTYPRNLLADHLNRRTLAGIVVIETWSTFCNQMLVRLHRMTSPSLWRNGSSLRLFRFSDITSPERTTVAQSREHLTDFHLNLNIFYLEIWYFGLGIKSKRCVLYCPI